MFQNIYTLKNGLHFILTGAHILSSIAGLFQSENFTGNKLLYLFNAVKGKGIFGGP